MPRARNTNQKATSRPRSRSLMVRMEEEARAMLTRAAELRGVSVSDYVRTVTLEQARKEIKAAEEQTIALTPEEQLAFWEALNQRAPLTPNQQKLGEIMRGER